MLPRRAFYGTRAHSWCKSCHKAYIKSSATRSLAAARAQARRETLATRPRPEGCEVCGRSSPTGRALHWDHSHVGGAFRGWLCHGCNIALGMCADNAGILRKLADYIERNEPPAAPEIFL